MNHFQDDQAMDTDGNESHYNMNTQYNSRKNNNTRNNGNNNYSSNKSIHPLQQEYQQQPWLIPHPSLFISWKNNDHASHHSRENSYDRHFVVGAEAEPGGDRRSANYSISPPPQRITRHDNQPMPGGTKSLPSQLQGYRLQQHRPPVPVPLSSEQQQQQQQLQHYRDTASDQGHESDPSELLRAPILFNGSAHPTVVSGFGSRDEQDVYTIRRPNRSMSLSIGSSGANSYDDYNVWHAARRISPPALPPPSSMDHREVVPYSQEWRVILRSEARGRTVLYNPQMQSLVVQTTVGLDSHSMDMSNPTSAFMDTNYFRMLADANIALSRRGSLQGDTSSQSRPDSSLGSPTSSGRASLDLDSTLASMHGSNSVCDTIMKESTQSSQSASSAAHLSHDALNQGYYERFFMEQRKLGRGFRGSVFLCQHVLDGIHLGEYAIKKVAVGDNHDWLVQMLREVHLLERLHHPNIVGYKHAWLENHQLHKFGPEVTCLFILMECANGGNLEEYIERPPEVSFSVDAEEHLGAADVVNTADESTLDSKKAMSAKERLQSKRQRLQNSLTSPGGKSGEGNNAFTQGSVSSYPRHYLSISEIWSFFFDICEGLAHLHRLGIIHRDLKPPNLLLSYSDSRVKGSKGERPRILITDFGECEISDQAAKRDRTGATGTLEFLAPELLAVDANGRYTDEFSFKGDMWSLGMVLYYLCYSRLPYSQIEDVDILRKEIRALKSISIPEDDGLGGRIIPEELKTLIRVLLSPEKSKRPSCDDILSMLNHQRDRMMHGEMDSPTAPIRSSTDANYKGPPTAADTEPSLLAMAEAEEIRDVEEDEAMKEMSAVSSSRSQLSRKRSNRGLQPAHHRHGYLIRHRQNPIISVSGKGRRSSKAGLAAEVPKPGRAMLTSAINRDNTASPSLNLNKKVKPLGLGLRHMLRRRMMHPIANGVGAFKSIRSNNDSSYNRYLQGYGAREGDMNMWSNTPSTVTFPIEVSKKVPSILAPTEYPGSQNDSSSNSIIKSLNRQSNTAPIDQPADHSRTRLNEGENSIQDMTRESANIPDGDKEVDMEVKQVINALPETGVSRKISDDGIIEPETTPAIVEDGKPGPKLIRQKPRQDVSMSSL
ncbi:hypothetical protein BCR41DRAFT_371918 [Lobosporangium transversale]|uniref:non-specific serine/threonine protein kinase n=1 Tax=Lobosporangium transversale TaxID=64571 RepID=A0A1Y2GKA4_9FUNG|nr:hypothetical protein BCR41DRAFT_371918 [Lobosporangium transversale]ORZ12097.1 hypothetical protein BCR41DRAFT_371918 [Lobosporangium transversale]|eukprot:XP_021879962.1 hypothetical protein BCR41DRAFT_371918 [Lobosporangium transversale]